MIVGTAGAGVGGAGINTHCCSVPGCAATCLRSVPEWSKNHSRAINAWGAGVWNGYARVHAANSASMHVEFVTSQPGQAGADVLDEFWIERREA